MATRKLREAPAELLDPDGEGIYLLDEWSNDAPFGWPVIEAARRLNVFDDDGRLDWRGIDLEVVYMEPSADGETWNRTLAGRWPQGWRLNLPRRWRPVTYMYCTPRPEAYVS